MAGIYHPSRGGTRGGQDQFNWDDVKGDKERENYLGHSVMVPTGRWQEGKDLIWYTRDNKKNSQTEKELKKKQEMKAVKDLEARAMAAALGHQSFTTGTTSLTAKELQEVLSRGKTEHGDAERIQGVGHKKSSSSKTQKSGMTFQGFDPSKVGQFDEDGDQDESSSKKKKRKKEKKAKKKKKKHHKQSPDVEHSDDQESYSKEHSRRRRSPDREYRRRDKYSSRSRFKDDNTRHRDDNTRHRDDNTRHREESYRYRNENSRQSRDYNDSGHYSSRRDGDREERRLETYDKQSRKSRSRSRSNDRRIGHRRDNERERRRRHDSSSSGNGR